MNQIEYYKSYCSGCGLCHAANDTELQMNGKGFIEPNINEIAFQEKYCPVSEKNCDDLCSSAEIWGDYVKVVRGYSSDPGTRERASSGGVITELATYLIESGKVDAVIHIGVGKTLLETTVFCSTSREEILSHAGSRYIQTSPLKNICQYLEEKKRYVFIGKPCDVMVLRNYLKYHTEYPGKILCYLSFFCAGMPSMRVNELLLEKMGCSKEKLVSFDYRGNGWPGFATAKTETDEYKMSYENAWGRTLGRDKHKYCRVCMDGIGLFVDVACADAWNIKDGKPDFSEEDGRNLIIARNEIGLDIIQAAEKAGYIITEEYKRFDVEMPIIQKYQYERRATMVAQLLALKVCGKKTPKYRMGALTKYRKNVSAKNLINIFWGTLKRIYSGRYS